MIEKGWYGDYESGFSEISNIEKQILYVFIHDNKIRSILQKLCSIMVAKCVSWRKTE